MRAAYCGNSIGASRYSAKRAARQQLNDDLREGDILVVWESRAVRRSVDGRRSLFNGGAVAGGDRRPVGAPLLWLQGPGSMSSSRRRWARPRSGRQSGLDGRVLLARHIHCDVCRHRIVRPALEDNLSEDPAFAEDHLSFSFGAVSRRPHNQYATGADVGWCGRYSDDPRLRVGDTLDE